MILLQNLKNRVRMGVGIILLQYPPVKASTGVRNWLKIEIDSHFHLQYCAVTTTANENESHYQYRTP
jgi:hypothetical protein